MSRKVLIPGPQHPITTATATEHVTVRAGDTVVADTRAAVVLREADYPAVYYVPRADVAPDVLKPSDTTTYCPFKGDASYFTVVAGDSELDDAVWYYPEPFDAVAQIKDHVAFYADKVDITVT